jgi:hypothetical protein
MADLDFILKIAIIVCSVVGILSGMFVTHLIYEEREHSFFEMWFFGFYMSLHLIPLLFYNFYKKETGLTLPLWVFRGSVLLGIILTIVRSRVET